MTLVCSICPYVPLSMMKTIGENDFQPSIGFKTRYGIADNPFVTAGNGNNVYYRKRKTVYKILLTFLKLH